MNLLPLPLGEGWGEGIVNNNMQSIRKIIEQEPIQPSAQLWSPFQNTDYRKKSIERRRALRKNATPQEIILWSRIRNIQLGKKFRRQHSIGPYIVDFYCPENQLVIEVDGSQHFDEDDVLYDKQRTRFLESQGCVVLRFANNEVNTNIDGVLMRIVGELKICNPHPSPLPQGEE